jgi:competence protein ComGC
MEFLSDLWRFLMERKKWWLVPMILVLILLAILIVLPAGSAVAPFIYTIF